MQFSDLFFVIIVPLIAAAIAAWAAHYLASQRGASQERRLARELEKAHEREKMLETQLAEVKSLAQNRGLILLRWQQEYLEPLIRIREQARLDIVLPFDPVRLAVSPGDQEIISHITDEVASLHEANVNIRPDVLVHLGLLAAVRGDESGARGHFERAITQDATSHEARANLGILLYRAGDFVHADEQFTALAELAPHRWEGYYGAGISRIAAHQPDKAVGMLSEAIRIRPEEPKTFCALGRAYAAGGEMERAMESIQVALKLNTRHAEARMLLQELLLKAGRFGDVIEECRRFLTRQEDPVVYYHLATAHSLSGDAEPALQALRRAMQMDDRLRARAAEDQNLLSLRDSRRFKELLEGKPGLF